MSLLIQSKHVHTFPQNCTKLTVRLHLFSLSCRKRFLTWSPCEWMRYASCNERSNRRSALLLLANGQCVACTTWRTSSKINITKRRWVVWFRPDAHGTSPWTAGWCFLFGVDWVLGLVFDSGPDLSKTLWIGVVAFVLGERWARDNLLRLLLSVALHYCFCGFSKCVCQSCKHDSAKLAQLQKDVRGGLAIMNALVFLRLVW